MNVVALFLSAAIFAGPIQERFGPFIAPPILSQPEEVAIASDVVVNAVTPILQERLEAMRYDRTTPATQFLRFYEQQKKHNPSATEREIFRQFRLNPLSPEDQGGPCYILTLDLQRHLPPETPFYIALGKLSSRFQQPAFPTYSHTALLMKYKNTDEDSGYILLDPSFDLHVPIVVQQSGKPVFYDARKKGIWKFFIDGEKLICETGIDPAHPDRPLPEDQRVVYDTRRVVNPLESSAMPMILADRRLSFLTRRQDGSHRAHLNIELHKNRVVWDQDGKRFTPISFEEIEAGWQFPDWFAERLDISAEKLTAKIANIVKHRHVFAALRREYIETIENTGDVSITGPLR